MPADPVVTRIPLEDATPVIVAAFANDPCLIWSGEWRAYWREGGHGYTKFADQAGLYTIEAAYARTRHCGPEKSIAFERTHRTPAPAGDVRADTVAFVQEWMLSGDYEPDQWTRDFAAAIDARPTTDSSAVSGSAEGGVSRIAIDIRSLRDQMQRIADRPPNDQPAYRDGVRPFGTGDLRHFIDTLDAAAAALTEGQQS